MKKNATTSTADAKSSDLHQIQHIIVSLSSSGLSLFHKSFSGEIEPDLFSALLTATSLLMRDDGSNPLTGKYEIYQVDEKTATICQGIYLAGILISDAPVANHLVQRLEKFITAFEEEYGFLLNNWHGDRTFFDQDWANYQLMECMVSESSSYRLNMKAMEILKNARQIRLVLIIKRFAGESAFSLESVSDLLVQKLIIPKQDAMEFLSELEANGIIMSANS
ncbi:MAG: hypothetical protein P1Q69_13350 [Candidatus Thorarchaeota archaeon]|nr:hypothetical protein [Candidatus Thorarchaeota archaeon]